MTCAQGLLRLLWGGARSWSATGLALFACLSSHWVTTTGRLLGPTPCLLHKDEGIPLKALLIDTTSKLAGKLTVPVVMIK